MAQDPSESVVQLLDSALDLFGRLGFDGASTRAIAAAAGKPMSAITYHFGGKEELYVAVARYLSQRIGAHIAPAMEAALSASPEDSPAETRARLRTIVSTFLTMMVRPESAAWARFMVREQMEPTRAFDMLYAAPIGPMLGHATTLMRRASGNRIGEEEARLRALALFGQVLVFRVARATVLRSNGWDDIGEAEGEHIRAVILAQLDAILDSLAQEEPS